MRLDIRTLDSLLVILSLLQLAVFLFFYWLDRNAQGRRDWVLWSALYAAGYLCLMVCPVLSVSMVAFSAILTNCLLFGAQLFLYRGLAAFVNRRPNRVLMVVTSLFFILCTLVAVFALKNDNLRAVVLYLSSALVMGACGKVLIMHPLPEVIRVSRYVGILFLVSGLFYVFRVIASITVLPLTVMVDPDFFRMILFVFPFMLVYLWSFGIVFMVNQESLVIHGDIERHLELVFNMNPDAIVITLLPYGIISEINDGFTRLTGFTREDVIGRTSSNLDLWVNLDDRKRLYESASSNDIIRDYELSLRRKDGTVIVANISSRVFTVKYSRYLVSAFHDITERKWMETALQRSEEKFRLLVENNYDVIYTIDNNGIFLFVSPAWKRLLGHDVDEVEGRSFVDFVHPDDIPACRAFLKSIVEEGDRQTGVEYRIRHKNGAWLWHTSSGVPFCNEEGVVSGYYGIARDISANKKMQDELRTQAMTDCLTGIYNRRYFLDLAANELKRSKRLGLSLSVALLDIDCFKNINDTHGHSAGDMALVFLTGALKANIRAIDLLCRFGGDEFIIMFPETTEIQAVEILDRIGDALKDATFETESGNRISLTVSAGVTRARCDGDSLDSFINRADEALYRAKEAGKNRITVL